MGNVITSYSIHYTKLYDVSLDTSTRECKVNDEVITLTPTEFDLLAYLARHPNQVFSRSKLLEATDLGAFEGVRNNFV